MMTGRRFSLQTESAECGLACLAAAASVLGAEVALSDLRRQHPVSARGLTFRDMAQVGMSMGLVCRGVRCDLIDLADLARPSILHWGLNHFVVLLKASKKCALVFDPAAGVRKVLWSELDAQYTGVALEITRAPTFKRRKERSPLKLSSLLRPTGTMGSAFGQILILSVLLQLFLVASPFYMQIAIDQAALKGDLDLLGVLAFGFGLFAVFNVVVELLRGLALQRITALVSWDMTTRLHRHMVKLPLAWFQRRRLADVFTRFESIDPVRQLIANGLVATLIDGILGIVTVTMMVLFSPTLAAIVVAGLLVAVLVRLAAIPLTIRLGAEALAASIAEQGKRIETMRAIQTIKIMAAESERESDWANRYSKVVESNQASTLAMLAVSTSQKAFDAIINVVVIYIGVKAIIEGSLSIGILYAFMSYKQQFVNRANNFVDQFIGWRMLDMHSERLADIVLTPVEAGLDNTSAGLPTMRGEVSLKGVSFRYSPTDQPVLSNINLEIRQGEFLAITGPSGAGKSTLLKVICGLYELSGGEVSIDQHSLASWGPRAVRKSIGVVMQDDELLAGSIAENVSFFDEAIDIDWVWECLAIAGMTDEVQAMPMRAETLVGDMGSALSGGQKQRVLLARALYRRPKILILDEATSHLDLERERAITESIRGLDLTRIIVAHRPETVRAADRVVILNGGRLYAPPNATKVVQ